MTRKACRDAGESASSEAADGGMTFEPVKLRYRRDGLTPERQVAFIRALAECGCVRDACRHVGISPESVYELARRPDAQSFRVAWDMAMDQAVRRIDDEAFSRCIHGVAVPHFYQGERIGEHRRYDERLAMFILRYRRPERYGRHLDRCAPGGHPEDAALTFGDALAWVASDARREAQGLPRMVRSDCFDEDREEDGEDRPPRDRTNIFRFAPGSLDRSSFGEDAEAPCEAKTGEVDFAPDVASTSSTSGGAPPAAGARER